MSDRLRAMASNVVDVSNHSGATRSGNVGGTPTRRDPRDDVKMRQESGY